MATTTSSPGPSHPSLAGRIAAALFLAESGFSLAMPGILVWLLFRFLHRAEDSGPPFFIHWLIVFYPVMGWLYWIRMFMSLAAFGFFMAWVYVLYRDLRRRGAQTRYSPGWALGGFFVPFLNFAWPYMAVSEAWKGAAKMSRSAGTSVASAPSTPLVIKLWWALVLVTVVIGVAGGKAVLPGKMELSAVLLSWYLIGAASSLLAVAVIAAVERQRLTLPPTRPIGFLGPWPLTATAGTAAVFATVIVVAASFGLATLGMSQLRAEGGAGIEALPPEVIPPGALPPRPASSWDVQAEFTPRGVYVTWRGQRLDLSGYNIYRRDNDGPPMKMNAELLQVPEYVDGRIEDGHTYGYSVCAVDRGGSESPRSVEAVLAIPNATARPEELRLPTETAGIEGGVPGGVVGGVPGGVPGGAIGGVIGGEPPPPSTQASKPAAIVVPGALLQGMLIHQVKPAYPPLARQARITGMVVLKVGVSREGKVQSVQLIKGHPILTQAAIDAVRQWRYKPYLLNGEPVEVASVVAVDFKLAD